MSKKLTKGQASCLVLGLVPTDENRKVSKSKLESIGLSAMYTNKSSFMEPTAIATTIQQKNPFKYFTYDDTPPGSPAENTKKKGITYIFLI